MRRLALGICSFLGVLFGFGGLGTAHAGGGSERVLVVINEASPMSQRIARRYCELRAIPDNHVVFLRWVPGTGYGGGVTVPLEQVLDTIVVPVLDEVDRRDLVNEIDTIVYSTGFPYMVDIRSFAERHGLAGTSTASLTGVTYFAHQVLRDDPAWIGYEANGYYRGGAPQTASNTRPLTDAERKSQRAAYDAYQAKEYADSAKLYDEYLATYRDDATSWYNLACCRALIGLHRQALDALEMAVAAGWSDAPWTLQDKDFAPLRIDPRFQELVKVMAAREPVVFPTRGYRMGAIWSPKSEPEATSVWEASQSAGGGYYLSSMLGYTGTRGNSEPEILRLLEQAVAIEGTEPDGTVYFLRSRDALTRVRSAQFAAAKIELEALGVPVELLDPTMEEQDGVFPRGKLNVLGAMLGADDVDFEDAASRLVPGSLCDNSSEWSAAFWSPKATKISEYLRHGCVFAAGPITQSGTFASMFPAARLYAHYVRGCTTAESYFQSVSSPYHLLLLGDPLTAPFARLPKVTAPAISGPVAGDVAWVPEVAGTAGHDVDHVELWVDGWWRIDAAPGEPLALDTEKLDEGWHEARVVAVSASEIGWRQSAPFEFSVSNHGRQLDFSAAEEPIPHGGAIPFFGVAAGADQVEIGDGSRVLATLEPAPNGSFEGELESSSFSHGSFHLHARARWPDSIYAAARPVDVTVEPPAMTEAVNAPQAELLGLRGTARGSEGRTASFAVTNLEPGCIWPLYEAWQDVGGEVGATVLLEGLLQVEASGDYELHASSSMAMELAIGRETVLDIETPDSLSHCASVRLEEGFHPIRFTLTTNEYAWSFQASLAGAMPGRYLDETVLRIPGDQARPADPKPSIGMGGIYAQATLQDGDPLGDAQAIPSGRFELSWRRTERVQAIVLYFPDDTEPGSVPLDWTVERKSGRSWIDLAGVDVMPGWDGRRGSREKAAPAWIALRFPATRAKEFRIAPASEVQSVRVTEVEALTRD